MDLDVMPGTAAAILGQRWGETDMLLAEKRDGGRNLCPEWPHVVAQEISGETHPTSRSSTPW